MKTLTLAGVALLGVALAGCTPKAPVQTAAPAPSVTAQAPVVSRAAPSVLPPTAEPTTQTTVSVPATTMASPTLNPGVKSVADAQWSGSYGTVRLDVLDAARIFPVVAVGQAQILASVPVAVVNAGDASVDPSALTDMSVLPVWRSDSSVCAQKGLVSKVGNFCALLGETTLGKGFTAAIAPGAQASGAVSVASARAAVQGDEATFKKAAAKPDGFVVARKNTTSPALKSCEVVPGFQVAASSVDLGC